MKVTEEYCDAKIALIEADTKVLACDRALWMISANAVSTGKDVHVISKKHFIVEKGEKLPASVEMVDEQFLSLEELEEMIFKSEIESSFLKMMMEYLEKGDTVLYNEQEKTFRVLEKNKPYMLY
jgi:hypothetical protein